MGALSLKSCVNLRSLSSLSLYFLIYKVEIIIAPTLEHFGMGVNGTKCLMHC